MNYLAHFYLAFPEPALTFGNFIADGVRGSATQAYSAEVQRGIRFHRFVDAFTDASPQVKAAKKEFAPHGKYAGVLVDVWFDHLLAKNWEHFHADPLAQFAPRCTALVQHYAEPLPPRSERFLGYLVQTNALVNYAHRDGMVKVLQGMDTRTRFPTLLAHSWQQFAPAEAELWVLFQDFFTSLLEASDDWKLSQK